MKRMIIDGIEYELKPIVKAVKKDYEILSLNNKYGDPLLINNDGTYGCYNVSLNRILDGGAVILSVKRVSDNEVFTIGDKVIWGTLATTLTEFRLVEGNKINVYGEGFGVMFSEIEKVKERKPLFVSEDGKEIFEGDEIVLLSTTNWITHKMKVPPDLKSAPFEGENRSFLYFSTEEKAKEFVIENRPCLSFRDICGLWIIDKLARERLKELVKQKINV